MTLQALFQVWNKMGSEAGHRQISHVSAVQAGLVLTDVYASSSKTRLENVVGPDAANELLLKSVSVLSFIDSCNQ